MPRSQGKVLAGPSGCSEIFSTLGPITYEENVQLGRRKRMTLSENRVRRSTGAQKFSSRPPQKWQLAIGIRMPDHSSSISYSG